MKDECKQVFTDIKLGRKYRYVVYRLTDDLKEITVESTAGVGKSFYQCFSQLSNSLCNNMSEQLPVAAETTRIN